MAVGSFPACSLALWSKRCCRLWESSTQPLWIRRRTNVGSQVQHLYFVEVLGRVSRATDLRELALEQDLRFRELPRRGRGPVCASDRHTFVSLRRMEEPRSSLRTNQAGEDSAASFPQHQSSCIFSWGIQLKLCLGLARWDRCLLWEEKRFEISYVGKHCLVAF